MRQPCSPPGLIGRRPLRPLQSRRAWATWLMALVLVLEMLSPVAIAGAATARTIGAALDGDHIVVCTATGIMVLDRDGRPAEPGDGAGASGFCQLCLPLLHCGAAPPAGPALALDRPSSSPPPVPRPDRRRTIAPAPLAGAATPQAPPTI